MNPTCFVIMPFGKKQRSTGEFVDFDEVYLKLIYPAIIAAKLDPVRADAETLGGIIHKPMFERLILCDFAVVDLTTSNANVFYELGVRHAAKPFSTVAIFEKQEILPFDLNLLRCLPYNLSELHSSIQGLTEKLIEARKGIDDSPIFQLVDGFSPPNMAESAKADFFAKTTEYEKIISRCCEAEREGTKGLLCIERELAPIDSLEVGLAIQLCRSYRAVSDWNNMLRVINGMSPFLKNTTFIQEQLAFALNRSGDDQKAEVVLEKLIALYGGSSEQFGLLGRIYKDRWQKHVNSEKTFLAESWLDKAISIYARGFEANPCDYYPGINALSLMQIKQSTSDEYRQLFPVVEYAINRIKKTGKLTYWDVAAEFELEILKNNATTARTLFNKMLTFSPESWQLDTTMDNVRLLADAETKCKADVTWLMEFLDDAKHFSEVA